MRRLGLTIASLCAALLSANAGAPDPGYSFSVGADTLGRTCMARRMFGDPNVRSEGDRAYELYCGGDQEPVASIYLLGTDSARRWQDESRKSCIDPHVITEGDGAAILLCKGRGGPESGASAEQSKVVVSRAQSGGFAGGDGAPQTADILSRAAAIALGIEPAPKRAGAAGPRSTTMERLSAALGADVTVQQFDYQTLVEAGNQSNALWLFSQAGRYFSAAIAAHRVQWPNDKTGDADLKLEYALNLSNQQRSAEAARLFADAEQTAGSDSYIAAKLAAYRAADALNRGDRVAAIGHAVNARALIKQNAPGFTRTDDDGRRMVLLSAIVWRVQSSIDRGDPVKIRSDLASANAELDRLPTGVALWMRVLITKDLAQLEMRENRAGAAAKLLTAEIDRLSRWATGTRIEGNLRIALAEALAQSGDESGAEGAYQAAFRIFADQPENPGASVESAVPYIRFLIGRRGKADTAHKAALDAAIFAAYESIVSEATTRTATEAAARIAAGTNGKLVRDWQDAVRSYRRAQARYNTLSAKTSASDPALMAMADQVDGLRKKADTLGRKVYADVPRYELVANRPVGLGELQAALQPGEVFARIAIGADGGAGLLISRDAVRPYIIAGDAATIATLVKRVKEAAAKQRASAWKPADIEATHTLYETVFGEGAGDLVAQGTTRVIIDANGDLASLPFAMLSTASVPAHTALADVPWLIKSLAVEVTPGTRSFLARDPVRKGDGVKFVGFAAASGLSPKGDERRRQLANVLAARYLPASCEQSVARFVIQEALPGSGPDVVASAGALHLQPRLFAGAEFRPEKLKDPEVAAADVLMFSTHGLAARGNSGADTCVPPIALLASAPDLAGPGDMLIDVPAVLDLNLSAKLVVLAACSTGTPVPPNPGESGLPSGGDALSGLTRAFLYAGARSVLMTHWAIPDNTAVMTQFFKAMAEGPDSVEALRKAQLKTMENPLTASPYYWASFSSVGATKL